MAQFFASNRSKCHNLYLSVPSVVLKSYEADQARRKADFEQKVKVTSIASNHWLYISFSIPYRVINNDSFFLLQKYYNQWLLDLLGTHQMWYIWKILPL